jgi:putative transposase
MIDSRHPQLSVARQCELVGLARSSFYYQPVAPDPFTLDVMHAIDRIYTDHPFYGVRRIWKSLRDDHGYEVNHKRVHRLMQQMGLQAIYPRKSLSQPNKEHRVYPYLLGGLTIDRPNQAWCSDITYVRLRGGFVYLVAVMDWFSRYVLSWRISNTLDAAFCLAALEESLAKARPEIFNTDQGAQFTSTEFTGSVEAAGIRISMDGRGRFLDNIFIERLWRSLKYEDIYLKDYETVAALIDGVDAYFAFYNDRRPHQTFDYETPAHVYFEAA